jgi:enamine deaminase RidA (YjgF/YER057c/UK114 family)
MVSTSSEPEMVQRWEWVGVTLYRAPYASGERRRARMTVEEKLKELGYSLPQAPQPIGTYVGAVQTGNLVFVSGHGPRRPDGTSMQGKVGGELSREQGYEAARLCMLGCLASIKRAIGDLDKVQRVVKVLGMVNCTEDFGEQPAVINGGSDLLVELFGERGRHARSAVGMQGLPNNIPVEIELIVEVSP